MEGRVEERRACRGWKKQRFPAAFALMPVPQSPLGSRFLFLLFEPGVQLSRTEFSFEIMPSLKRNFPPAPADVPNFACAFNALWSCRTVSGAVRPAPVSGILSAFPTFLSNRDPFARSAFPGFPGSPGLSATQPVQAGPRGLPAFPSARRLAPLSRRRPPERRSFVQLHWRFRSLAAFPGTAAGRPPH